MVLSNDQMEVPHSWDVIIAHYLTLAAFTALWAVFGCLWVLVVSRLRPKTAMLSLSAALIGASLCVTLQFGHFGHFGLAGSLE